MMSQAKRAVIYTRVSRDDTGEGKSNQRQEEDCRKLADLRGWEVTTVEADVSVSASTGKVRPAWERVLGMIERGEVDVVIAWHFDRIARSMIDLEHLIVLAEEHGVGIATVVGDMDLTTDMGQMVARILAAVARQEVQRKARRQKLANQQRAAQGIPWQSGFRAFGFELDGTLRKPEAELIRSAAEAVLAGKSLRSVVRDWNATEHRTDRQAKAGNVWTHRSVRAVLLNPRNAGIATYRGDVIGKGAWEPIVAEDTHILLTAKLTDPKRNSRGGSKGGRKASNLLTGIAVCATCGETVQAGGSKQGPTYQCKGYHVATLRGEADEAVRGAVLATLSTTRPGLLIPTRPADSDSDAWAEAETIRERLTLLSTSFASGSISIEQLEAATASLNIQLADVETRLTEAGDEPATLAEPRREALQHFDSLDLDGQRDILTRHAVVTLYPKGRGNKRGRVTIKEQVTVFLRVPTKDGGTRLIPALNERTADRPTLASADLPA